MTEWQIREISAIEKPYYLQFAGGEATGEADRGLIGRQEEWEACAEPLVFSEKEEGRAEKTL